MIPAIIALAIILWLIASVTLAPVVMRLCKTAPVELPDMHVDGSAVDELNMIRLRATSRRERFEAEEDTDMRRACELCGVDYDSGSYGSELACEIVSHTQHVVPTLRRIEDWRGMVGVSDGT